MTKDTQRAILRACARYIQRGLAPILKRLDAVEKAAGDIATKGDVETVKRSLEQRVDGVTLLPGPPGPAGKDAEPVLVADIVKELLATDALVPLLDLMVAEAVAKHLEANPIPAGRDGKDGAPGPQGEPGAKGADGKDGADGIGLASALIDRSGELVVTLTNGTQKALGVVVGKDGRDGADGLSFEDFAGEYVAERGFVLRATRGEVSREFVLPYMKHVGFWSEGKSVKSGESATHDGALWIAKRDTNAKPCLENAEDWILAARKGRDGKDGRNGIDKTAPVRVG